MNAYVNKDGYCQSCATEIATNQKAQHARWHENTQAEVSATWTRLLHDLAFLKDFANLPIQVTLPETKIAALEAQITALESKQDTLYKVIKTLQEKPTHKKYKKQLSNLFELWWQVSEDLRGADQDHLETTILLFSETDRADTWRKKAKKRTKRKNLAPRMLRPSDPEPPVGSIIAITGGLPIYRDRTGWRLRGEYTHWDNFDLKSGYILLRHGWK